MFQVYLVKMQKHEKKNAPPEKNISTHLCLSTYYKKNLSIKPWMKILAAASHIFNPLCTQTYSQIEILSRKTLRIKIRWRAREEEEGASMYSFFLSSIDSGMETLYLSREVPPATFSAAWLPAQNVSTPGYSALPAKSFNQPQKKLHTSDSRCDLTYRVKTNHLPHFNEKKYICFPCFHLVQSADIYVHGHHEY